MGSIYKLKLAAVTAQVLLYEDNTVLRNELSLLRVLIVCTTRIRSSGICSIWLLGSGFKSTANLSRLTAFASAPRNAVALH